MAYKVSMAMTGCCLAPKLMEPYWLGSAVTANVSGPRAALPAGLTAPFLAGRSVVIGDATPASSTCCRVRTALFSTALAPMDRFRFPVLAGNAAVAVTRNGGIWLQPE
jgi:hypothetical protein